MILSGHRQVRTSKYRIDTGKSRGWIDVMLCLVMGQGLLRTAETEATMKGARIMPKVTHEIDHSRRIIIVIHPEHHPLI